MHLRWILLLILLYSVELKAQSVLPQKDPGSDLFNHTELLEDINLLRSILIDAHPSLYRYNSESEIDNLFRDLVSIIKPRETETEIYRKILEVVAKINCGHTWINASEQLSDSLWQNIERFPLKVTIIDDQLIYSGHDLPSIKKGNEIVSINGHRSQKIIESFLRYTIGDGYIQTGRIRMIERRFGFYFALLHGFPSTYDITFLDEFQNVFQVAISSGSISPSITEKENKKKANIHLSTIDSTTGNLRIAGFSDWTFGNEKFAFKTVLQETFEEISKKKFENLVIDLRDNRGGSDAYGLALLSYLVSDSIVPFNKMVSKTIGSPLLRAYSNLDEEVYQGLPEITTRIDDGTYIYCQQMWMRVLESDLPESTAFVPCNEPFPPLKPSFSGNIFLLINGNTFSTAADVSSVLFSRGSATFFGEETGGGYYGNSSGITATVSLPNTKFHLRLPLIQYKTNVKNILPEGRGVLPHHPFSETAKSLKSKDDELFNYVINTIKNKNQ